ncbi:MAG: hypothetical protein HY862_21015 [Chloroflexi bacterium]|nr:hypothetical protein [Chloroflexota bacterium]
MSTKTLNRRPAFSAVIIPLILLMLVLGLTGCDNGIVIAQERTQAGTFYVSPEGSDNNPGSLEKPWATLRKATQEAIAGDVMIIRGGTYYEPLIPLRSGTEEAPITYQAYENETPILDGQESVLRNIELRDLQYIVIDGLRVQHPRAAWALLDHSEYITFQNMQFMNPEYPADSVRDFWGVRLRYSSFNKILNSTFDQWGRYQNGDQEGNHIGIQGNEEAGGYNLIEGNTFTYGAQGCIIVNSPYNIVRNNVFDNDWQKGIYVAWFTNPGDEPAGTEWPAIGNLIENNQFIRSKHSDSEHGGLGYEGTSVNTIFRYNVIRNSDHLGLIITVFGNGYALRDYGTHIYNNTIVNNGLEQFEYEGTGISITNWGLETELHDEVVKNNIVFGNLAGQGGAVHQLSLNVTGAANNPPFAGTVIAGNLIQSPRAEACDVSLQNTGNGEGNCPIYIHNVGDASSVWFNEKYPDVFYGNIEDDPLFNTYDPTNNDFDLTLQPNSPAIDAGVALTVTKDGGSGTEIPVEDAGYFHDSYQGMIEADTIVVGKETVKIVAIDYTANLITVDRAIEWVANAPVNLTFKGDGPDIGAFEYDPN